MFFKDSCLFKASWGVYSAHIYCSIATHPDGKIKENQKIERNTFLHIYFRHYQPGQIRCIFFEWLTGTDLESRMLCGGSERCHQVPSTRKGPQLSNPATSFDEHVLKQPFFFMQLYVLLLLWLLIPRTTYKCSQLSLSNWKQLHYTVIVINTLIRTFTNVSRRLFKSMHFMHRWWSSSESCSVSLRAQTLSSQLPVHSKPSAFLLRAVNLRHPAPVWNYSHRHELLFKKKKSFIFFWPTYCHSRVVSECWTASYTSTMPCSLNLSHHIFQPQRTWNFFSTDFFLLIHNKPHGTLDNYETRQSLHFSL